MSSNEYGVFDLLTLVLGLKTLKTRPSRAKTGRDFWLKQQADGTYTTRELVGFWEVPRNPFQKVIPFPGWLAARLIGSFTSQSRPFRAIGFEELQTRDLLETHIFPDMFGESPYTKAFTQPSDSDYLRHFRTSLVLGYAETENTEGSLLTLGGGLRRQTMVHRPGLEHEALKIDVEFFTPFFVGTENFESIPADQEVPTRASAIQFGLAISRQGQALGEDEALNLAGIRIHARVPLDLQKNTTSQGDAFALGCPEIQVETLDLANGGSEGTWQDTTSPESWQATFSALLASEEGKVLLAAPIGPITTQPISYDSLLDLFSKKLVKVKDSGKRSIEELKEIKAFIEGFLQYGRIPEQEDPDDPDDPLDLSNLRSLGDFLTTLGFLEKDGKKFTLRDTESLNFWQVLNLLANDLDGLPLWVKGLDPPSEPEADQDKKPVMPPTAVALQLASAARTTDPTTHFFGLRGLAANIALKKPKGIKSERDIEVLLQLGQFFSKESRENNWIRRLEPLLEDGKTQAPGRLPGIGIYPFTVALNQSGESGAQVAPRWGFRMDLVSLGLDISGRNKLGLINLPFFKLGGIEIRVMASVDWVAGETWPVATFAIGAKFNDIRLLTKREPTKDDDDDIFAGIMEMFSQNEAKLDTRLSEETKDKFSLSLGFMTAIGPNAYPTFDAQLYNAKGKPGETVWIKIDRKKGFVYLKDIGIRLKGMNHVRFEKDTFGKDAKLAILFTGGLRFANVELGLIGAGLEFSAADLAKPSFELEGLDLSFKAGDVVISGSFLKQKNDFMGHVRVQLPIMTLAAMGAFGKTKDGTTSMFVYGAYSAPEGGGIGGAAFKITGIALGFGINRRIVVPSVHKVANFSLVKMVMGKGGLPEEMPISTDPRDQMGIAMDKPMEVLKAMGKELTPEKGQNFGCLGLRFTIAETIDCFALGIVQFGNELEISLLGLARLKLPRTMPGEAQTTICYAELQLAATLKPKAGILKVEAVLSNNSWVFDKRCKLTGGFAVYVWFDGDHKGDFVITLGGYHPRFIRPGHYPVVPRLGIRWPVTKNLMFKGGLYLAITPSCGMAGGSFEACFKTERLRAWFRIFLDVVVEWQPLFFELAMGIGIKVEVDLLLVSLSFELSVSLMIWGPPFGGLAHVDLDIISFDIPFGSKREEATPKTIGTWQEFLDTVLIPPAADPQASQVKSPPSIDIQLVSGQMATPPQTALRKKEAAGLLVRSDELQLSLTTTVPSNQFATGRVAEATINALPTCPIGTTLVMDQALPIAQKRVEKKRANLGVRPMNAALHSPLTVAVISESTSASLDLEDWQMELSQAAVPAALWDPESPPPSPKREPDARLIEDCITGLGSIRPPLGKTTQSLKRPLEHDELGWVKLPPRRGPAIATSAQTATPAPPLAELQNALTRKKSTREASAEHLRALGFAL